MFLITIRIKCLRPIFLKKFSLQRYWNINKVFSTVWGTLLDKNLNIKIVTYKLNSVIDKSYLLLTFVFKCKFKNSVMMLWSCNCHMALDFVLPLSSWPSTFGQHKAPINHGTCSLLVSSLLPPSSDTKMHTKDILNLLLESGRSFQIHQTLVISPIVRLQLSSLPIERNT